MAEGTDRGDERLEELLRVNAELAAEIRSLTLGRAVAPRSTAGPASRGLVKLEAERDELVAELELTRAERDRLEQHNQELGRQIHARAQEVERLSSGGLGVLRRMRAKLRDRRRR